MNTNDTNETIASVATILLRCMRSATLVACVLCATPASAQLGVDLLGQTLGTALGRSAPAVAPAAPAAPAVIPTQASVGVLRFTAAAGTSVRRLYPSNGKPLFDVTLDTPSFTNFASSTRPGSPLHKGTCFGMSFLTHLWYERVVRPCQTGRDPEPYRSYPLRAQDLTLAEQIFGLSLPQRLNAVSDAADGVNYITSTIGERHGEQWVDVAAMKARPQNFHLRNVCRAVGEADAKKAAICHHDDQAHTRAVHFDGTDTNATRNWVHGLTWQLNDHGVVPFDMMQFGPGTLWGVGSCTLSHTCLLYRISEIEVEVVGTTQKRNAWKLHLYDPNRDYSNDGLAQFGFGYGSYLIYFPDTQKITFCKEMLDMYASSGLQAGASFIDGRFTKVGSYDPQWWDQNLQQHLGVRKMLSGITGAGVPVDGTRYCAVAATRAVVPRTSISMPRAMRKRPSKRLTNWM